MIERPVFQPSLHLEVFAGEGALLLSEHGHRVLPGQTHVLVKQRRNNAAKPTNVGYSTAMCGRIARERADYDLRFGFEEESETRLGYNIGPMQMDFFVRGDADHRRLVASRWGLVPVWAKDQSIGSKMINARAETLLERPSYRGLVAAHRCIIPASGFYEWQKTPGGKTPMYIHRANRQPLALAGLWSAWKKPDGDLLTSHTIITCGPNALMRDIHDRMPAILDDEDVDAWLDPANRASADLLPLLRSYRETGLTAHAVGPLVNSIRNDGPELILPVAS